MSLRFSYTLIAPVYDRFVARATRRERVRNLAALIGRAPSRVLLSGVGTGLDLPHLPRQHSYLALDLTPAMLKRALHRANGLQLQGIQGDAMRLPLPDACVDAVVLHLILAVVPNAARCLDEAARVLRPGGELLVFDKFLAAGRPAPVRRALTPFSRHIATRLDLELEPLLAAHPELQLVERHAGPVGGWFQRLRLRRQPA